MRKHAALALLSMLGATWFSLDLYLHDETRGVGRLFSRDLACGRRPLGNSFPVEDKQAPVFVVTTIIKNERPNIREWIEYNKMAGVDLHIIYDNDSSDDVGDILDPYIRRGEVLFLPWPPRRMEMEDNAQKPDIDRDMRASYQTAMEVCDGSLGTTSSHHIQERCQQAAVIDAIQKARRLNAHWIGVFDVSDFVFPGDAAYRHSVVDVLRDKFDHVDVLEVQGFVFGTNGHMSRPARGDLDLFSSLAIESYTRRAPSESATGWDAHEFDSFHFGWKSIVKPHTVTGIKGHLFEYSSSARVEKLPGENDFLLLNRYHYHSKAEADAKAAANLDRLRAYDVERDALMSQVVDTRLRDRVLVPLREKLQQVHLDDPPLTSDDIEKDIFDFHPVGNKKPELIPDLCVAVLTCRRIGLARETISRFIRYMHQFEPAISYELVLVDNDSGKAQTHQIWNDFPLDKVTLFRSNEGLASGLNALLFGSCRAPYVLTIEDDWLARVENWRPDLPVIEMSMNVLKQDDKVLEVWLRDIDNELPAHLAHRTGWIDVPETAITPIASPRLPPDSVESHWPRTFQYRRQQHLGDHLWGTYTNGASVKSRKILQKLGHLRGVNGEEDYALRVNSGGYSSAHLCLPDSDRTPCAPDWMDGKPILEGLFKHGGTRGRSPGHQDLSHIPINSPGW